MSIKDGLLVEIERETANTRKLIERLSNDNWDYKPHEKSSSAGPLAAHIVELHNWVGEAITQDTFNFIDYKPSEISSIEGLLEALDAGLEKSKNFVNSQSDDFWMSEWTFKHGDHIIAKLPRIGAFRFIITNHLIHHRGQLTVYMRLLDIPLPGIYGPSADEMMA